MKKILLTITILGLSTLCANAKEFTVADTVSQDYLINNGYSSSAVEIVGRSKARAMGEEYNGYVDRSLFRNRAGWFGKFLRYTDPSLDDDSFMNHDIKYYPSIYDL